MIKGGLPLPTIRLVKGDGARELHQMVTEERWGEGASPDGCRRVRGRESFTRWLPTGERTRELGQMVAEGGGDEGARQMVADGRGDERTKALLQAAALKSSAVVCI